MKRITLLFLCSSLFAPSFPPFVNLELWTAIEDFKEFMISNHTKTKHEFFDLVLEDPEAKILANIFSKILLQNNCYKKAIIMTLKNGDRLEAESQQNTKNPEDHHQVWTMLFDVLWLLTLEKKVSPEFVKEIVKMKIEENENYHLSVNFNPAHYHHTVVTELMPACKKFLPSFMCFEKTNLQHLPLGRISNYKKGKKFYFAGVTKTLRITKDEQLGEIIQDNIIHETENPTSFFKSFNTSLYQYKGMKKSL